MRWIFIIILALIVLLASYTVWPIYDLYRIAAAVETRNPEALQELVDFPSLRNSLVRQIVDANPKLTGKSAGESERSGNLAAGFELAKILTPQRVLDLLSEESADQSAQSGLAAPFTANSFGSAWQIWLNSDYSGRTFYVTVPVDRPSDQRFRVRLRLVHWDWKLSGLDLPERTMTQLTQELARAMGDR